MRECFIHNNKIESVFQLLGEHENDITYGVGWILSQSDAFFEEFLKLILKTKNINNQARIHLQRYNEKEGGYTDIEIESDEFHLIIEAKKGWGLPTIEQLMRYERRLTNSKGKAILVTMSECSNEYFKHHMNTKNLNYQLVHISWKSLQNIIKKAQSLDNYAGKRLLHQFLAYLGKIMTIQNKDSNWVYVVSVASGSPENWRISWRDIIEKKFRYFHPISGNGWPNTPPNYIAFRYDGILQSIHHIDGYLVTEKLQDEIKELPSQDWGPHFVYNLGPFIKPPKEVRTGNIYRNGRVWCMIDALLTSKTISEARDVSKLRIE